MEREKSRAINRPVFPVMTKLTTVERAGGSIHAMQPTYTEGMSIRDYFAGQALTGMLSYSGEKGGNGNWVNNADPKDVARDAYIYADAMLEESYK